MQLTPEQVKGRIKNVAKENKADARTLMRIYMMERFLERVANSQYKDNFIIKGGMLVTAMVGVALRSTMDIDTSIKNQNLSAEDARRIVDEIKDIDLGDGVTFEVKEVSNIMDEMEYPGIRFTMNAVMGKLVTPMKIDISTGDVITPKGLYRSLGSIDVVAAARSVLQVERDAEKSDIRIVRQIKNSLAPSDGEIKFSITAEQGFKWLECEIKPDPSAEPETPVFESKSEKAAYLIKKLLSGGDMRSREIYMRMSDEGISRRTAENTKKELGIRSYRKMRQWYWSMKPEE